MAETTTNEDMTAVFKWQYGDTLYGTFAKGNKAMQSYRDDINAAYGQEGNYRHLYVDTFSKKKTIGEQLKS